MTVDPASAGRLYVEVEGDTGGFGRRLQAKIDAEVRNVRARVQTEIDARRLQADLDAAVRRTRAKLSLPVAIDTARLSADLRAAIAAAQTRAGALNVDVNVDTAAAEAAITEVARNRRATVEVGADAATAEAEIDAAARDRTANVKVNADTSALDRLKSASSGLFSGSLGIITGPGLWGAMAQGIDLAVVAVGQLAGGLVAMASAAAPAVGLAAALPAAGATLVSGLAPVIASFMGVGKAVTAMDASQKTATSSTLVLAQAQEAAAQRIVVARRSLGDALVSQQDAQIQGDEAVHAAEEALTTAQYQAVQAQQALTTAREQARRALRDYSDQLADAALNERSAKLGVEQAKANLDAVNHSATSTELQRDQAQLSYDQAVQNLVDVRHHNADLRKDAAAASKAGVDGATAVVDAQHGVVTANQNVDDQETALADARRQRAEGNHRALEAVKAAQEGLTQAIDAERVAMQRQTTQASAAQVALSNLSPAGRDFAHFIVNSLIPNLHEVEGAAQSAFLPPLQDGLSAAQRLLPQFNELMATTGGVMGHIAERALKMVSSGPWRRDFSTITHQSAGALREIGHALDPILRVIRDLTVAAGPFITRFAHRIADSAQNLAGLVGQSRRSGALTDFFQRAYRAAHLVWGVVKSIGGAIANIGRAAAPAGRQLLRALGGAAERLKAVTEPGTHGGNQLKAYFDHAVPGIEAMGRLIAGVVKAIGQISMQQNIAPLLDQITNEFLPAVVKSFGQIASNFGPAFVRLITNLVKLFGDLGGGSGGLTAAVNALNGLTEALRWALNHVPLAHRFVAILLSVGGAATGIGLVAGGIGKLTSKITGLVKHIPGVERVFNKLKGAIKGSTEEIDNELPKDDAKKKALGDVEGASEGAARTLGGRLKTAIKGAGEAFSNAGRRLDDWAAKMGGRALNGVKTLGSHIGAAASAAKDFGKQMVLSGVSAVRAAAKWVATKAAALAVKAAEYAQVAATKAVTAAQWLLNAAMEANPIGLIIAALVALAIGLYELWQHSETFRRIVTAAFNAVWDAIKAVWGWVKDHWPLLLSILTGPIGAMVIFIVRHWDQIKRIFTAAFSWVADKWSGFWHSLKDIGSRIFGAVRDAIATVWDHIKGVFTGAWHFLTTAWSDFWNGLKRLTSTIFGGVKDAISWILGHIKSAFHSTVRDIGLIWQELKHIAAVPVGFIVNTVYNKGIRWAWNKVAGLVGLGDLPEAHFTVPPGVDISFSTGGVAPGYAPGRDTITAKLSPGEGVLTPETTRAIGGAPAINALNRAYTPRMGGSTTRSSSSGGIPHFGFGGFVGGIGHGIGSGLDAIGSAGGAIYSGGKWIAGHALDLARRAAAASISTLLGPIRSELHSVADGSGWTSALAGMFDRVIDSVIDKIRGTTTPTEGHATGGVIGGRGGRDSVISRMTPGEGVLTPATTAWFGGAAGIAALNRDPLGAVMAAAAGAGGASPVVIDRSVTFEDGAFRVYNPSPEPASDSINTRLRRTAALGVFN